jgi:hypothetical protein
MAGRSALHKIKKNTQFALIDRARLNGCFHLSQEKLKTMELFFNLPTAIEGQLSNGNFL